MAKASYAMGKSNYAQPFLAEIKEGISNRTAQINFCTGASPEEMQALYVTVARTCLFSRSRQGP